MKQLVIVSVFVLVFAFSHAQTKNKEDKKPDIFFTEKSIDFGTIKEGVNPKVVFKFYNSGTAPLVLKQVKASCGCTASKWPREPILPGDSNSITATFNSRGYAGRNVHKSITVTTNVKQQNGNDEVIILFFKGFVERKGG